MTTCLGNSCSFGLPRVPFVNCCQFMYLVISLLVLRAGCGIWLYQFLIIAYLFAQLYVHCTYSQTNEYMTIYDNQDEGHSLTFVHCHLDSTFSNFFSSKTLNLIWSLHGMLGWKFVQMLQVTWPRWLPAHIQKTPSSESWVWWPWNLVYSIRYSSTTKFVQMITLGWPWPFLWQNNWSNLFLNDSASARESLYSIWSCISELVLIKHMLCTQVSDTGPLVLWFKCCVSFYVQYS